MSYPPGCTQSDHDREQLERDFVKLLYAALAINDQLRIEVDHVEFEGGMNQVEHFRELVNRLHWQHAVLCKRVHP